MEGDGEKYLLLLCSLSPSPPLQRFVTEMTDPHMDTLPSRCMESTHDGKGHSLPASHRPGGGGQPGQGEASHSEELSTPI